MTENAQNAGTNELREARRDSSASQHVQTRGTFYKAAADKVYLGRFLGIENIQPKNGRQISLLSQQSSIYWETT
jgi:hypothetical protein